MNKCQKCGTSWIAQVMACPECGKDMSEAAVPDDPVAVLLSLMPKQDVGVLRFPEWHEAIRALAAHYEAKGMRRAAEICDQEARKLNKAEQPLGANGAFNCRDAILAAAAKQEADR